MQDTIIIKGIDSSYTAKKNNLILIYNQKGQQEITDTPIIISTITAVFVAFITTYITYLFNKRKNNYEIDKLKEETLNLKKTFQPIVIGTIQSIQDKIITNKIDALKLLVAIRNNFWYHEQQYHEGEPMTPDYDDYLELLFYGFSNEQYNQYDKFHNAYSYLFPDNVFKVLTDLKKALSSLNEAKKSYDSMDDPEINLHKDDKKQIESIISLFSNAIELIRKDCHLDTSFIHEFIEENKK